VALKQAPAEISISAVLETLKKMREGQIQQDYGYIRDSASRKLMGLEGSNIAINISSICQTSI
jgi:hypothetical protein